jgi:large subunit ribosomal protein L23
MKVLLSPIISEKGSGNSTEEVKQYAFKVLPGATKREIAASVEKMFQVQVENVRVLNVKGKRKRTARGMGTRKNWRKAYVRLRKGYEIDMGSA